MKQETLGDQEKKYMQNNKNSKKNRCTDADETQTSHRRKEKAGGGMSKQASHINTTLLTLFLLSGNTKHITQTFLSHSRAEQTDSTEQVATKPYLRASFLLLSGRRSQRLVPVRKNPTNNHLPTCNTPG
ncbi:hypothetical protein E2C01_053358 [Portunus trituberculatus]|uniref:Uncharacterized protein n=1 Tax=Portunus trituberculatus TaxID=210409 RepID=A0A5B7GP00_PORTR|nr:hypothetical protein [Portunus trituberculatus]